MPEKKKQTKKQKVEERTGQLLKMCSPWKKGEAVGVNIRHSFRKNGYTHFLKDMTAEQIEVECAALKETLYTLKNLHDEGGVEGLDTALKGIGHQGVFGLED